MTQTILVIFLPFTILFSFQVKLHSSSESNANCSNKTCHLWYAPLPKHAIHGMNRMNTYPKRGKLNMSYPCLKQILRDWYCLLDHVLWSLEHGAKRGMEQFYGDKTTTDTQIQSPHYLVLFRAGFHFHHTAETFLYFTRKYGLSQWWLFFYWQISTSRSHFTSRSCVSFYFQKVGFDSEILQYFFGKFLLYI